MKLEDLEWYWIRYDNDFGSEVAPAQYIAKDKSFNSYKFCRVSEDRVRVISKITKPTEV